MNARDDKALASPSPKRPKAARAGQGAGAPAPLFGTSTRTPPRSLAPVSAARQRKLHVGHFAFMRSVVQGLDPRESWERYFRVEGEATDQRTVRATIAWIRDEFAAAAKREDRFGTARLVRIDATRIADPSLELPSLEAFAEAHGLEDERQADQIAAYEAEYGRATQRLRRRARLIARQLEALRWLESLVAQSPKAGDSVAAWLNPTLASHLEAADIFTLAQLVERINGVGRRWHAGIKAMGEGKALRIVEWLREHQDSIALQLGRHVAMPRSKLYAHELQAVVLPATDIRPLEKFIVPAELDGTRGLYRRPQAQCLLKATNDYQAILAWLRSKHGLTPSRRRTSRRAGVSGTPASSRAWTGCRRCRTPSAPTARKPSASCSGRSRTRARPVLDEQRGLHRVPGLPGRPAAAQPLVRRPRARALVAAVAAVRGAAVGIGAAARGHDPEEPVRLPRRPELPDGQPVVGGRRAAHFGAEGERGAEFQPGAVAVHRRAAEDAAGDFVEPAADLRAAPALCDRAAAVGSGGRNGR
jgi:DNA-binding transcriptional ArsR family regulator